MATQEYQSSATAQGMIRSHPAREGGDDIALISCIQSCFDCAQACTACADACLGEEHRAELFRCIRLNLDCADICDATGHVLSRQTAPDPLVTGELLRACVTACQACADECSLHAPHMQHCRICEAACRACERACGQLLSERAH